MTPHPTHRHECGNCAGLIPCHRPPAECDGPPTCPHCQDGLPGILAPAGPCRGRHMDDLVVRLVTTLLEEPAPANHAEAVALARLLAADVHRAGWAPVAELAEARP